MNPGAGLRPLRPAVLLTLAFVVCALWDASGWDWAVTAWFGSPQGFAARETFWARDLLHEGLRRAALLFWAVLAFDALRLRPVAQGPSRAARRWALGLGLLILLVVPALKSVSQTSCPWSLQAYGSTAQWVSHWRWGVPDGGPGHCFPSGHTAGMAAACIWLWLWAPHRHAAVRTWRLLLGCVLGAVVLGSLAQVARGAHFVSHVLWSAWLCALLGWALLALARRVHPAAWVLATPPMPENAPCSPTDTPSTPATTPTS